MAQSSNTSSVNPEEIIGSEFFARQRVDLTKNNGGFTATNVNGKVMFNFTFNDPHIFLNAARKPLVTLKHETSTARWQVFRGDKTQLNKLLFSVVESTHDVFLAKSKVCDFKIQGEWVDQSLTISPMHGNPPRMIAQMHRNYGNKKDIITVHPNEDYPAVDCAFIVALVVVLEKI
ncbi:hypothetical protein RHSIM_Rhsim05G0218400 [Rhododendron simsii]|uniref:Uncharacterized protein n=1 Tax=Rhododendron simsii TaxID=118357 RepID=A0A834GWV9_RHOSS|nr:hypothetical protein RHSIM_Rhsim05G0218400 [Rhododendron simsii]